MKKQIIGLALSVACILGSASAFAEVTPKVIVDGCEIAFDDQAPIIEKDRILIPVRGVMEAAGARVGWFKESKLVQIQSHDNWKITELTLDSDIMKASAFSKTDLISADTKEIKLDVPATLRNDRTLIPLRAVNDSFDYDTSWDDATKTASVRTDRLLPEASDTGISISASKEDISKGDTVDILVSINNFTNEDVKVINGASIGLIYDKSKLKLVSAGLCNGDKEINGLGAVNPDFSEDSLKTVHVTVDEEACPTTDGVFYKLTFEALADDGGEVALSKRYNTRLGYDTTVLMSKDKKSTNCTPVTIYVDDTPVELK
ncbi:MAG: stalk domain-containing protein [Clostridia bacterium]|nr:stalk domain-containing protein [Clostridia bacterium]